MVSRQLKEFVHPVAQRCFESERVEADTLGTQVIERVGHLPIDVQPFFIVYHTKQVFVTTATYWLTANLMARLYRSIMKARVAGKCIDLKKEKFTLSSNSRELLD